MGWSFFCAAKRNAVCCMDMLPVERLFGLPVLKYFADAMQK
jgi:hypothetical protein